MLQYKFAVSGLINYKHSTYTIPGAKYVEVKQLANELEVELNNKGITSIVLVIVPYKGRKASHKKATKIPR